VSIRVNRKRAVLVVLAVSVISLVSLAAAGALPSFPTTRVNVDPYVDDIGYHASAEEPSIQAEKNPLRAAIPSRPGLVNRSTILSSYQVGRVYDGGASGIGYNISVDGGANWAHGEIPITVGSGQATTLAGPLTRASDTVVAYDKKHDVWLDSYLGIAGNANVPAVYVSVGTVDFAAGDINWGVPIVTHLTAATADSPDKNWITCDNWSTSAGYGNCYEEYDNNGNGNRLLMQVSSDGGQTWTATANTPPNGNTGDVAGETNLASPANAGDTNIKVLSVTGITVGEVLKVDLSPSNGNTTETVTVTAVGTAGAAGTGVTFTPALAGAHLGGAVVANSAAAVSGKTGGIGGVPLVQPPPPGSPAGTCGRVVVPVQVNGLSWFTSSDCGVTWSASNQIFPNMTATHTVAQGLRTSLLPSSTMDGTGAIYLTWQTRSFRVGTVGSTPNDIAMSVMPAPTAANPNPAFGPPVRIPIEADNTTANTVDHFIPGISADPATSGATAHLGLYYYSYPVAACVYANPAAYAAAGSQPQCNLQVGYVSSTDGGTTWSAPQYIAAMSLADVVRTSQGPMVGDYSNAAVIPAGPYAGNSISTFAIGLVPRSPADNGMNENMYVTTHGLAIDGGGAAATVATAAIAQTAQTQVDEQQAQQTSLPTVP
jgi:hypothetical protein